MLQLIIDICSMALLHWLFTMKANQMLQLRLVPIFDQPSNVTCLVLSVSQSYIPSCSQTSTRKSTISCQHCDKDGDKLKHALQKYQLEGAKILTERGIGWGNSLLLPSKLSYVAFQLQNQKFLNKLRQWVLTSNRKQFMNGSVLGTCATYLTTCDALIIHKKVTYMLIKINA